VKTIVALALSLLITGCATVSDLHKPAADRYFTLKQNYTRTQIQGLLKYKWVAGLQAGLYRLVGEDKEGLYFMGDNKDSVILLSEERAEKYLETGYITPFVERNVAQNTSAGGQGGLWLPKAGVKKEPRLFYTLHNTRSAVGLTEQAIMSMTEDSFAYIPFGAEMNFINAIEIKDGKP
jgi:hypothetical protein